MLHLGECSVQSVGPACASVVGKDRVSRTRGGPAGPALGLYRDVCVRTRNAAWLGRLRGVGRRLRRGPVEPPLVAHAAPRRLAKQLRASGFRHVQQYYVDPSLARSEFVIPITRQASAYSLQSRIRKGLSALGLHGLFFTAFISLAER